MKPEDIVFDEDMEMLFFLPDLNVDIYLILSDGLYAYEEELTEEYKSKIANFINNFPKWYPKSVESIVKRAKETYSIDAKSEDLRLTEIFVLFEQNEDELYGVEFSVEFDIEHGCGLQILGSNFEIVKIGTGDVAFC